MKPTTRRNERILAMAGLMLALGVTTLTADDHRWGYTGPGSGGSAGGYLNVQVTSVKQAKKLPDDAFVAVEGRIEQALKKDLYRLSDGEDSITVEIDDHLWYGLTVGPEDTVVVYGEVDKHLNGVVLEARRVMKK